MKNKKAISQWSIIFYIVGFLLSAYVIIYFLGSVNVAGVPLIPIFASIKANINYVLLLLFWIILQVVVVYAFYKLFSYGIRNFLRIKENLLRWSFNLRQYIIHRKK